VQFFHGCSIKGQDRNTISTDKKVPQGESRIHAMLKNTSGRQSLGNACRMGWV